MPPLHIKVEDTAGVKTGPGPIATATSWSYTYRLDQPGSVGLSMPATDARAALLADPDVLHYVRAQTKQGTVGRAEVGYGIIKSIGVNSETRLLNGDGPDLVDELIRTITSVFLHEVGNEDNPMPADEVFPALMASSLGWVVVDVNGDPAVPSKDIDPYQFNDETHLAALGRIAKNIGDHFRPITPDEQGTLGLGPRTIIWLPTTPDGFDAAWSGLTAVDHGETTALDSNPHVCLIVGGLQKEVDQTDRVTRVYPRGGGNAEARLYLNRATRFGATTIPTNTPGDYVDGDFELHVDALPENSYIRYVPGEPTSDDQIGVPETFSDIVPLKTSGAALINAANQLADAALIWLRQHIMAQEAYRLRVTKVHLPIKAGETIRVVCRHWTDGYGWILVNAFLMVLEARVTYTAGDGEPVWDVQVTK